MPAILLRCPITGQQVQSWANHDNDTYEMVECLACRRWHMVNTKTGKLLTAQEGPKALREG